MSIPTTPIQNTIQTKLEAGLELDHVEVINESHMHSVPPNSETHFKLVVVSPDFAGKRKVMRHQRVYQLLSDELAGPVHALALHLYTPEEWRERAELSPDSPQCHGGSR